MKSATKTDSITRPCSLDLELFKSKRERPSFLEYFITTDSKIVQEKLVRLHYS